MIVCVPKEIVSSRGSSCAKKRRAGICEDYSAVVVALQRDETLGTIEDGVRVEACRRVTNNLLYILYETYR